MRIDNVAADDARWLQLLIKAHTVLESELLLTMYRHAECGVLLGC
jgi:hypothetical protein